MSIYPLLQAAEGAFNTNYTAAWAQLGAAIGAGTGAVVTPIVF